MDTLCHTDKSGKLVLDTVENFNLCMRPHYENEEEVSIEQVHTAEARLNTHSQMWCDILMMGKEAGAGQSTRIEKAIVVNKSSAQGLGGFRKDHNPTTDSVQGPPLRPICNGKKRPDTACANIQSRLLKTVRAGISQTVNTEVLSTEEMQHHVMNLNTERARRVRRQQPVRAGVRPKLQNHELVLMSMDVSALYPNCLMETTGRSIEEAFRDCNLEFMVDRELLVGIVSVLTGGTTAHQDLNQFLSIPKRTTTLKSFLKRRRAAQFARPAEREARMLSKSQVARLLGIASAKTVKTVMANHFFTIAGKLFRQRDGSPIGLDMSVETASLVMLMWDRRFLKKLKTLGLSVGLYKRYVDDILLGMDSVNPGWFYNLGTKKMEFDQTHPTASLAPDLFKFSWT